MQTKTTKHLQRYGLLLLLYISGPLFLLFTNPQNMPLPLLVLPFLWLFIALFTGSWWLLQRRQGISRQQTILVSSLIAALPVLLAIFQSIHQLSIKDVLLSVGIVVLAALYMLRADFIR